MTAAELAAIHSAAFNTQRPWTEDEFSELLGSPLTFLIEAENSCFALGRVIADEAELLTIATHPDAQRSGLAIKCLSEFLDHCRQLGVSRVFLEVDAKNNGAIALYDQFEFAQSGRRAEYYKHPDGTRSDAVLMAKTLG